jgi:predicted transcriptional regulator
MAEATFTFRVDQDLKTAFSEAAKAEDRTAAQLLRQLMREEVRRRQEAAEHDAWFRAQVRQALREADDPNVRYVPHEEVKERLRRQREELLKRAGGTSRED